MKEMKKRSRKLTGMIHILVLCIACSFFCPSIVGASEQERKTVRVGYYPVSDYQEINEEGTYSGFSYDYYVQIQKYTRWNYEFIEASYADCMQMLMNGEIDIMSGLTASPEREDVFIYSDYSNSNSQYKIYARADDDNLYYESYDAFDGCKVGMVTGVKTDELEAYSKAHKFSVEIVNYNSYAELEAALADGSVDMVCGASLSDNAKTKIVARLKKQPLYYAVSKNRPDIAEELNDALQKIIDNNPEFYTQMSEKYKINGANAAATFTKEEVEYIQSGKPIYLVVNNDLPPISWLDKKTGAYRGISIDVAGKLEKYSGLNIIPVLGDEFDKLAVENPDIMGDALVLTADDTAWADNRSIMMTNHVIESTIVMITKTGKIVDIAQKETRIALPKNYYISYALTDLVKNNEVQYYDTVEQCLNAVNKGNADVTFENSLVARYFLSMQKYTNLYIYTESGLSENLSYGVYIDSDTPLLSILDKSLLCIGDKEINEIAIQYAHAEERFSFEGLYYSNPVLTISMILILCVLIGAVIFFRMKAKNAEKSNKQEKILARFMGYVCAANEAVLEVNLIDFMAKEYTVDENGMVHASEFPYTQIHGENYNEQIHPDDYEKLMGNFSEEALDEMINRDGGGKYFECRSRNKLGEYHWYSYTLRAIPKDREHPRNFILFKKNIDDAKKEEEKSRQILEDALQTARDASEAKGNFLSRISHEIRTPLNAVIGYLSIARQQDSNRDKVEHCLENSEIASKHLLGILNDVLDMSSIESGKLALIKERFNMLALLQDLKNIYQQQAVNKKIDFTMEIENLNREWLLGDRMRVNQILFNLVSNAIKFTAENGRVLVKATQIDSQKQKSRMKFEISDTGIGMSDEYMNRLFKPFEQESAKNAQKFGGTGLGLSIAWNLITMMGGSIEVNSKQGVGTTFTVLLSFDYSDEMQAPVKEEFDFSHVRVLVLDDEKSDCDYVKNLLKQFGMKCDTMQSCEKAVQRIISRKQTDYSYRLIIMDWNMPKINGIDAIRQIREKADADIPIIMMTAYDRSAILAEAMEAGAAKVMSKPLFQSTLFNAMVDLFGKYLPKNAENELQRDFHGIRILLAEDNEMNMEIAVEVLRRSGLLVDTAVNGEEAYRAFTESEPGTYQGILMDIQMPVMDGYEATRQIRASKHKQAKEIPIIATTANAFSEDVSAALACGMNGHIAKPIDYKKLYQALDKSIPQKEIK